MKSAPIGSSIGQCNDEGTHRLSQAFCTGVGRRRLIDAGHGRCRLAVLADVRHIHFVPRGGAAAAAPATAAAAAAARRGICVRVDPGGRPAAHRPERRRMTST